MEQRVSARAIIIEDNKIYLMYRRKNGRGFYAFPGGGRENNESLKHCVRRELIEELGINVVPKKLLYKYVSKTSIQYFFLCAYKDGVFGTGTGIEFTNNPKDNYYEPRIVSLSKLSALDISPREVKKQLLNDLKCGNLSSSKSIIQIVDGK